MFHTFLIRFSFADYLSTFVHFFPQFQGLRFCAQTSAVCRVLNTYQDIDDYWCMIRMNHRFCPAVISCYIPIISPIVGWCEQGRCRDLRCSRWHQPWLPAAAWSWSHRPWRPWRVAPWGSWWQQLVHHQVGLGAWERHSCRVTQGNAEYQKRKVCTCLHHVQHFLAFFGGLWMICRICLFKLVQTRSCRSFECHHRRPTRSVGRPWMKLLEHLE